MKDLWKATVVIVVSVLAASMIVSVAVMSTHDGDDGTTTQYRIYVGLNDKDSGTQIISLDNAKDILDGICQEHVGGYTLQVSEGMWTDDSGDIVRETSLVCIFDGTDIGTIYAICDEILTALNQSSILIESSEVRTEYYSG